MCVRVCVYLTGPGHRLLSPAQHLAGGELSGYMSYGASCHPADYNSSELKTACRKHELYVSFQDLGWLVTFPLLTPRQVSVQGEAQLWGSLIFFCVQQID